MVLFENARTARTLIARTVLAAAAAAFFAVVVSVAVPHTAFAQSVDDPLTAEEQQLAAGAASAASARDLDTARWAWPLPSIGIDHISQDFWSGHGALDIWAAKGTPIITSRAGIVVATEASNPMELDGYGNCVVVYHNDGTESYYAHMSVREVNVGDVVTAGQEIGLVGNTGNSFGDHLHFEIRVNATPEEFYWGQRIDPYPYIVTNGVPNAALYNTGYADVPDYEWYADYVVLATELGLMGDRGQEYYFDPEGSISRGEVFTIMYRAATGATANDPFATENTTPYGDNCENTFYTAAINWAYANGLLQADAACRPDDPINREELATVMARYASLVHGVSIAAASDDVLMSAADWDDVSPFAREALAWTAENDILSGIDQPDGTKLIDPQGDAERSQMAKIIVRTLEVVG